MNSWKLNAQATVKLEKLDTYLPSNARMFVALPAIVSHLCTCSSVIRTSVFRLQIAAVCATCG